MTLLQPLAQPGLPDRAEKQLALQFIEGGEARIEAGLNGSLFEKSHREGMYGRDRGGLEVPQCLPCPPGFRARRALLEFLPQPHFHFSRGFFGEGNGGDRREPDGRSVRPLFQHQMQNPVDQDAGLAGAGRGLHGEGAVRLARGPLAIELERDHSSSSKRPSTILI